MSGAKQRGPKKGVTRFNEVHVVSNTHWDREFRMSFQRTRFGLVEMMDSLLNLLEEDREYASYTLDSQAIVVEDYLAVRPESRQRIEALARSGRLWIGPWLTLPDIPNIGQEAVVRNLLHGEQVADRLGVKPMKVGYTPFSWGQTGQLPQIYAGFGIRDAIFYRGISPHESPAEFLWEGADGTRMVAQRCALFARYNFYYLVFRQITYGLGFNDREWFWGVDGETPFRKADDSFNGVELLEPKVLYEKDRLESAFRHMLEFEGGEYQYPIFLAMHGHDISWPHPLESRVIKDANTVLSGTRVIHSDFRSYFQRLRKELREEDMTVLKGERRSNLKWGYWTYLLPATVSARSYLKRQNFMTEWALVGCAEPFAAMSWLDGAEYPEVWLGMAWKYLLANHTHDANAGCASDEVSADVEYRYRQSRELSGCVIDSSLKRLIRRVDTSDCDSGDVLLALFNPLPFVGDQVVPVTMDFPEKTGVMSFDLVGSDGGIVTYQLRQISPEGLFVDNRWNVPQTFLTKRFRLFVEAKSLPAAGYETCRVVPRATPDRRSGSLLPSPNTLENEYLRVSVQPNGALSLCDKENGAQYQDLGWLCDQGEAGNAWRHQAPESDLIINSLGNSSVCSVVEDGPLFATLRVDLSLRVPRELDARERRSVEWVVMPVTHHVSLAKGARRVEVSTRFDNVARDHWLRLMFSTGIRTRVSHADSHFDVVERPIPLPDCDDWKEPVVGTYPFRSFVDLTDGKHGIAFIGEGLQEFEVMDDESRTLAISLVRSVRIKLEVSEQRKQELPDVGAQCQGSQMFRWALFPHAGRWDEAECPREALHFLTPPVAVQFGKNRSGNQPRRRSFVELDSRILVMSAMKLGPKGNSLIVRVYNPSDRSAHGSLRFEIPVKRAWQVSLNEERTNPENVVRGSVLKLLVAAKKIVTYELVFRRR